MPDFRSGVWLLSRKGPQDSCANEVLLRLTRSGQVFKNCDTLSRTTKILHRTFKLPGLVVSINSLKIVLNNSPQKYYINIIPKMTPFTEKKCESWGYSSSFTPPHSQGTERSHFQSWRENDKQPFSFRELKLQAQVWNRPCLIKMCLYNFNRDICKR